MISKNYLAVIFLWMVCSLNVYGQGADAKRAHYNYMMFCQGCHLSDGSGTQDKVPEIKGYIGHFLGVEGGREFLVRVPGSAYAAIDDAGLAELLNWMIVEFGETSVPKVFQHYTAEEVGALRKDPLLNINDHRAALVDKINKQLAVGRKN